MPNSHDAGITRRQLSTACGLTAFITYVAATLTRPVEVRQQQSQSITIEAGLAVRSCSPCRRRQGYPQETKLDSAAAENTSEEVEQ